MEKTSVWPPVQFVGVFYATREGHTAKVAERVAFRLHELGYTSAAFNVKEEAHSFDLRNCDAVIVAASVHAGKHEKEMVDFVRSHRERLRAVPTAFISVTLSQAGAERNTATSEEHARFEADVQGMIDTFIKATDWHPAHIKPVAGALLYTKYNFLIRFVMKRISRKAGGDTDTSRDFDYTNWEDLDQFAQLLAKEFSQGTGLPIMAAAVGNHD